MLVLSRLSHVQGRIIQNEIESHLYYPEHTPYHLPQNLIPHLNRKTRFLPPKHTIPYHLISIIPAQSLHVCTYTIISAGLIIHGCRLRVGV